MTTGSRSAPSTPTPSLRRRVVLSSLAVLTLLLILLGAVLDLTLGAQVNRDLHDRLVAEGSRADALVAAGTAPAQLVAQLGGGTVRALLVTRSGQTFGDPAIDPLTRTGPIEPLPLPPPPPPIDGPPGAPPPPPPPPDGTATVVVHPLADGDRIILVADTTQATQVRRELRELMLTAGLFTLAVAGLLLVSVAARALRPLDRLTGLARDITTGDRGRRLVPDRPETDLGRAAAAFDGMLDALETAEQSATAAAREARGSARRAQLAADQARRAEAGTRRFLADAAHELRTPLAGIQAATEQLTAHEPAAESAAEPAAAPPSPDDGARRQRRLQLLLGETRRASRLVRDMLDLSRIDAGVNLEIEDADLVVIVEAEVDRAAVLAPSLTVTRTGADRVPVRADPARLSQVLSNLLDNARRHTPAGGTITVDVTADPDLATLTVTDTGPGIRDADRARVFDRLVRLDQARHRDHGGAGLGLPIARALAEAHGGTLICASHDGGARFELRLPVSVPPSDPAGTPHRPDDD